MGTMNFYHCMPDSIGVIFISGMTCIAKVKGYWGVKQKTPQIFRLEAFAFHVFDR
jgi:hypothetical protein